MRLPIVICGPAALLLAFGVQENHKLPTSAEQASVVSVETAASDTPLWILPVQDARNAAKNAGRPLLVLSLNGNLDGYC
jgi:hypothetical protein